LDPGYYPRPVPEEGDRSLQYLRGGFLTQKQFERLCDRCSDWLHATNPFSRPKSCRSSANGVPEFRVRITRRLALHTVSLKGIDEILLVSVSMQLDRPMRFVHLERADAGRV
jgi:hypothetical protein